MKEKLLLCFFCMSLVNGQTAHAENGVLSAKLELSHAPLGVLQAVENIAIKGKVVSGEDGEALPGVTVMVKGSSKGTVTDIEGNYSMMVPEGSVLVFSFVGFNSEEVTVGDQSTINVSLVPDLKQLDEVVIVGYGEQKRANLTGSVVSINAEEIQDLPVANLSQALIGRMAGVKVGQSTGKPGAANPITIRTSSSIAVPEVVLYVIDGIIFEDGGAQFNRLDPSEIETISILKDAAAAVYGARASGGVVLVKTKRGREGKPKLSYSTSVGIGSPTQLPPMLSPGQHARILNEMLYYKHGKYQTWDPETGQFISSPTFERDLKREVEYFTEDELAALDTLNYNWLDGLYKDAITVRHTLNLRGGTENVRYFVGGSYFSETGNLENLSASRFSVRANMDADLTKDFTFSLGVSTNRGSSIEPYNSDERSPGVLRDTYQRLLTAPGWVPPTIDGMPTFTPGMGNPYGLLASNNYKSGTSSNTNLTGALEYKVPFIKGLKAKAQLSYNESSGRGKQFAQGYYMYEFKKTGSRKHIYTNELVPKDAVKYRDNKESLTQSSSQSMFYQLNTSLTYNRDIGKHHIDGLLVYEQQEDEGNSFNAIKKEAAIKGFEQYWAFSNVGNEINGGASETGRLAYIGRVNYNYGGKYLFESAFRYEASQKFHPDHAWGFFPSVSAGWIISEEDFFRNSTSFFNFLKIRASAGRLGNDNVGAFMWKQQYGANTVGPIFGTTLTNAIEVKREGMASETITWQKTDIYNLGLDTRFLDHKINFSVDAYYRYGFDLLTRRSSYPMTLGVDKPPHENFGAMYANGVEVELGFRDKIRNEFEYSISGNISWDDARPLILDQNPAVIGRWDDQLLNHPTNQPGWVAGGIIRTQEDLDYVLTMYDSIDGVPVQMGMIWYHDIRGENWSDGPDGKLDTWDRDIIAQYTSPRFNYGLTLGASWKGLRISGTMSGQFGHKVFIQKDEQVLPTENSNVFAYWSDYWSPENPNASMPRPYQYGLMSQTSTFWMRDGHTLRLNNLNVSYAMPSALMQKLKLPDFRIYFTGTNIWTIISPFDYKDPSVSRAYDYPLIRTYNFGLNITI